MMSLDDYRRVFVDAQALAMYRPCSFNSEAAYMAAEKLCNVLRKEEKSPPYRAPRGGRCPLGHAPSPVPGDPMCDCGMYVYAKLQQKSRGY